MKRYDIRIKETSAAVICREIFIDIALSEIHRQRRLLETYIRRNPGFASSLVPVEVPGDAPPIVRKMASAAARTGTGPMAAVAGAIAAFTVEAAVDAGAKHFIMDNGGDIAMRIDRPVVVGIYTGPARLKNIGLKFLPRDDIIGVCTSSATVGHSLSFGKADAAVVISGDVLLADAAATMLGNRIQGQDRGEIETALASRLIPGIEAMIAVIDDTMAWYGNIPEMVNAAVGIEKISKG